MAVNITPTIFQENLWGEWLEAMMAEMQKSNVLYDAIMQRADPDLAMDEGL